MADANDDTCTVYGLASSEDGVVRYIGQTSGPLKRRVLRHISFAHRQRRRLTHRDRWLLKIERDGFEVVASVIQDDAMWNVSEMEWIARYADSGARLVNSTAGGEGINDPSPELRKRISESVKRLWQDPEYRARVGARKGTHWSAARREACDAVSHETRSDRARRGRAKLSPEQRSSIAAAAAAIGANTRRLAGTDRGVYTSSAKLDDDKVREIRAMRAGGCERVEVAKLFGVSRAAIRKIDLGQTWAHVT